MKRYFRFYAGIIRKLPWNSITYFILGISVFGNIALWADNHYLINQVISASSSSQHFADVGAISTTTAQAAAPTPSTVVGKMKEVNVSADHIRGNKNAKIMLVEYSDFECPFCKTEHDTLKKITAEYGNKIAWTYREFPLSIHANAEKEAEAAECVTELGGNDAFWKYADTIFTRTTSNGYGFALDKLEPLAGEVGVDPAAFTKCLNSNKYVQKIQDQITDGTTVGVTGTPGTVLIKSDGTKQMITGALPYETLKGIIDTALTSRS